MISRFEEHELGWPDLVPDAPDQTLREWQGLPAARLLETVQPAGDRASQDLPGLRAENRHLRTLVASLESRLARLEALVEGLDSPPAPEVSSSDPYLDWCDRNRARLEQHPSAFVAVDIERDEIVLAADTQEELSAKYRELPREQRIKLYKTHTYKRLG